MEVLIKDEREKKTRTVRDMENGELVVGNIMGAGSGKQELFMVVRHVCQVYPGDSVVVPVNGEKRDPGKRVWTNRSGTLLFENCRRVKRLIVELED
jgi:hypothetical protein